MFVRRKIIAPPHLPVTVVNTDSPITLDVEMSIILILITNFLLEVAYVVVSVSSDIKLSKSGKSSKFTKFLLLTIFLSKYL